MFAKILAAVAAASMMVPGAALAFGTATPTTLTDMHWVAGTGGTVPSPSSCGNITDIRLDITLNAGSTIFTANGRGNCSNTSDFVILTGSGLLDGSIAAINLYFADIRMECDINLNQGYAGTCGMFLLADASEQNTFSVTFTTAP